MTHGRTQEECVIRAIGVEIGERELSIAELSSTYGDFLVSCNTYAPVEDEPTLVLLLGRSDLLSLRGDASSMQVISSMGEQVQAGMIAEILGP